MAMKEQGKARGWVIVIVVAIVILAGIWYYLSQQQETLSSSQGSQQQQGRIGTLSGQQLFDAVLAKAPSIELKDVSNSGATGTAWIGVYQGKTYHRVEAQNLPQLPGDSFYEGWMVKNPATGDFFSTGKMTYNPATKEATLNFFTDGDKSEYRFVVITSEPNDGNPKPDVHIIEERFPPTVDLSLTLP